MRSRHLIRLALIAAAACQGLPAVAADGVSNAPLRPPTKTAPPFAPIQLFNSPNLEGLHVFTAVLREGAVLPEPVADPKQVFTVDAAGVLHIGGTKETRGYIRTTTAYADYKLTAEFRWPNPPAPGNSGLFIHVVGQDGIWPKMYEISVATGRVGNIETFLDARINEGTLGGRGSAPTATQTNLRTGGHRATVAAQEKPAGEWNTLEVVADGGTITVAVNGVQVNRVTGAKPNAGAIALQVEGAPVDYRNVILTPLPFAVTCVHAADGKDACVKDESRP